jgi:hypothetical protein
MYASQKQCEQKFCEKYSALAVLHEKIYKPVEKLQTVSPVLD